MHRATSTITGSGEWVSHMIDAVGPGVVGTVLAAGIVGAVTAALIQWRQLATLVTTVRHLEQTVRSQTRSEDQRHDTTARRLDAHEERLDGYGERLAAVEGRLDAS